MFTLYYTGGDRINLIPSGITIEDNHISRVGRVAAVGADGISHAGVHNVIRNNYIHHGTYSCITWAGNDHVMEYNHFQDCCQNSSDCGAVHCGRDWSMRGNYIRHNYFQNTHRNWPGAQVRGVMLDDEFSSVNIENNVFLNNEVHANIGGGRDNIIRYNIFYNATEIAIDVDARGLTGADLPQLEASLKKVPYTNALWSSRYPKLAAMAYDKVRGAPRGNEIYKNVYYAHDDRLMNYHGSFVVNDSYFNVADNYMAWLQNEFVSPENLNFDLQGAANEWAKSNDFPTPIAFKNVGPRIKPGPSYLHTDREKKHS
ncbi:uncharacterized protein LOC126824403 isoform X2 [Patella vulgata]|uniref:uncharacterized protein LOC126824403 isoform X2 n=1 Tax=Patella vulgata TaxID=6465 RepID=UPI0024A9FA05|nr:uncharacterized protein LOC126824403 isoform X2 [Patella vulgata]